jgi:hypothetical protein
VGHQIPNGDGAIGGDHIIAVLIGHGDCGVLPFRQIRANRLADGELSLLLKDQYGQCYDRLCLGGDTEQVIDLHWIADLDIPHSHGLVIDDLPVLENQGYRASQELLIHVPLHHVIESGQSF